MRRSLPYRTRVSMFEPRPLVPTMTQMRARMADGDWRLVGGGWGLDIAKAPLRCADMINTMIVQNLEVYKLSLALAIDVYRLTATFPKAETFGLVSQLRRAAVSIPCNMAEGGVRNSPKEFAHFVAIARGS